ncbi:hypothetical protein GF415_00700 [Candidatus Micrarchaeota archaeon]|nr:hypothetical protein [Candidatus Micrarchaeota archaeon]
MAGPSRKELKHAMQKLFLAKDKQGKRQHSREFTRLLFSFVEARAAGESEDAILEKQMAALGLFTNYLFRKNKEKREEGIPPEQILNTISEQADELFDELENSI